MKRIIRERLLTPEEVSGDQAIREQVAADFPGVTAMLTPAQAKELAEQITFIAGNVARVALFDAGAITDLSIENRCLDRAKCCERVEANKRRIADILSGRTSKSAKERRPRRSKTP